MDDAEARAGAKRRGAGRQPYRLVICGSNYGRAYAPAIEAGGGAYVTAAILARGSRRSRQLAERCGVPLHLSAADLPEDLDIACVALPAMADPVVLELLERGLHVLCEHPRQPALLEAAFERCDHSGAALHVNGHFADLPAATAFADRCRAQQGRPRRLEVVCQDRALYAAVDLIDRAFGPEPAGTGALPELRRVVGDGEFETLGTRLWGSELALTVQRPPAGTEDGSSRYLVDLRLSAVFEAGTVSMLSLAGPVTWNANLHIAREPARPLWRVLSPPTTLEDLQYARIDANRRALDRLVRHIEGGAVEPCVERRRTLRVARLWRHLGAA